MHDFVLVARNLGPAQLLDYPGGKLKAVVLEEGSPNAHVAIVARALDIPIVGQVRDALARIESGDPLIVDADHAQVLVRPSEDVRAMFRRSQMARDLRKAQYAALKGMPAVTRDGTAIGVSINAGLLVDMQHLAESEVDGVGLYRTEVPFMVRSDLPNVESQRQLYKKVLDYAAGKPVVFRTLDIGGDKVMPFWNHGAGREPGDGVASNPRLIRPACSASSTVASVGPSVGRSGPLRDVSDDRRGGGIPLRIVNCCIASFEESAKRTAVRRDRLRWARCSRCRRCSGNSTGCCER